MKVDLNEKEVDQITSDKAVSVNPFHPRAIANLLLKWSDFN